MPLAAIAPAVLPPLSVLDPDRHRAHLLDLDGLTLGLHFQRAFTLRRGPGEQGVEEGVKCAVLFFHAQHPEQDLRPPRGHPGAEEVLIAGPDAHAERQGQRHRGHVVGIFNPLLSLLF